MGFERESKVTAIEAFGNILFIIYPVPCHDIQEITLIGHVIGAVKRQALNVIRCEERGNIARRISFDYTYLGNIITNELFDFIELCYEKSILHPRHVIPIGCRQRFSPLLQELP